VVTVAPAGAHKPLGMSASAAANAVGLLPEKNGAKVGDEVEIV
jgi:hypothetical protein